MPKKVYNQAQTGKKAMEGNGPATFLTFFDTWQLLVQVRLRIYIPHSSADVNRVRLSSQRPEQRPRRFFLLTSLFKSAYFEELVAIASMARHQCEVC